MDRMHLGQRFEFLVAALLRLEGFSIKEEVIWGERYRIDLQIAQSGAIAVVEIKLYRSRNTPINPLLQAAAILEAARQALKAHKAILIVGGKISLLAKESLKNYPFLIVYDVDALAFLVSKHPHLLNEFEAITRELSAFTDALIPQPTRVDILADILELSTVTPAKPPLEETTIGQNLCAEIRALPTGRIHAKRFEEKVIEALKYIFDKDLTSWSPQKSSDTKLSFYDLVARVSSEHDFWISVSNLFRSRYIVFEFKNYTRKIKQGQIYTTEKYLFGKALRSTAIIISREGADANALAAARGALRESGKLIINLDIKDLCDMLHRKDSGDDHNTILVERVDEMLMRLER